MIDTQAISTQSRSSRSEQPGPGEARLHTSSATSALSALRFSSSRRGVVLLEVVLAMAIFFGAAMIILAGLSTSLRGVYRVGLDAQAQDLAVSLLSEIQMGLVPLTSDGPAEYEEEELVGWTYEIVVEPYDEPQLGTEMPEFHTVEVIIRHESGSSASLTTLMTEEQTTGATGEGVE